MWDTQLFGTHRTCPRLKRASLSAVSVLQAEACNTDTTPTQPHQISNTQRTENKTTDVVIQQHSRKLLMMAILMSETCWVHKKLNKIASDIKLVFYSLAITMMHGPINIRFPIMVSFIHFAQRRIQTSALQQPTLSCSQLCDLNLVPFKLMCLRV